MVQDPITILVVDDDLGHCELVRRNLRRSAVNNPVIVLHSGDDALDYVHARRAHAGRDPTEKILILLDINMPGATNGVDALRQLKGNATTRSLPVFMLTSTEDPREVASCYELGCNVYITKPVEPGGFVETIQRLGRMIEIVHVAPPAIEQPA